MGRHNNRGGEVKVKDYSQMEADLRAAWARRQTIHRSHTSSEAGAPVISRRFLIGVGRPVLKDSLGDLFEWVNKVAEKSHGYVKPFAQIAVLYASRDKLMHARNKRPPIGLHDTGVTSTAEELIEHLQTVSSPDETVDVLTHTVSWNKQAARSMTLRLAVEELPFIAEGVFLIGQERQQTAEFLRDGFRRQTADPVHSVTIGTLHDLSPRAADNFVSELNTRLLPDIKLEPVQIIYGNH